MRRREEAGDKKSRETKKWEERRKRQNESEEKERRECERKGNLGGRDRETGKQRETRVSSGSQGQM